MEKLFTALSLFALVLAGCGDDTPASNMHFVDPSNVFDELPVEQVSSALSTPVTPQFVRFVDDATWNDGSSNYRLEGGAVLWTDGNVYFQAFGTSGPRLDRITQICATCGQSSGTAMVQAFNPVIINCGADNPAWAFIGPYLDSREGALCFDGFRLTNCGGSGRYSGFYRPLGNGNLTNAQGGGVRAGFVLGTTAGAWWLAVQKTNGTTSVPDLCPTGHDPGGVGQWMLLPLPFSP
jgi:hypothetical protein